MRRKEKEKSEAFALDVLQRCQYATLSTVSLDGTPYGVPISPVLEQNTMGQNLVYFHCAVEGQKLDNILKNNHICLSCVGHTKLRPEKFSTDYESAIVTGTCTLVNDDDEKKMALRLIAQKYAASQMDTVDSYIQASLTKTTVCKISIQSITGKGKIYND